MPQQPNPKSYRDRLVAAIKGAGQDLVERADSLISPDLTLITGVDIHITLNPSEVPTLTISTSVIPERAFDEYRIKF